MSQDFDRSQFEFKRQAERMHRLDPLEFDDPLPPLRPYWHDLAYIAAGALLMVGVLVVWP